MASAPAPTGLVSSLADIAITTAKAAGRLLLERQPGIRQAATKSSPTDPVTDADRAAERLVVGAISAIRPEDEIFAEEGTRVAGTSGLRWVIDPLDGTVNYLYQRVGWVVSIAIEDSDGALVGVVVNPLHDETFSAVRGGGAYRDGEPLRVNDDVSAAMALVGTGFSYQRESRHRQGDLLARLLPSVRDVRRTGTCAGDLCDVAAGRLDAFLEDELSPWDWAAGALIAREAGATITRLRDGTDNHGLLVAPPALHGELAHLVAEKSGERQRP
ncbi:inositol monophosphatase family protein [Haloechinothrix salitolerans]|uniref:Inositol-1-monophosphatase n=1 Tax=Haloechinothrix salitolerans TaxID=926830 RepID=A0ABW2C6N4_9PSEU